MFRQFCAVIQEARPKAQEFFDGEKAQVLYSASLSQGKPDRLLAS